VQVEALQQQVSALLVRAHLADCWQAIATMKAQVQGSVAMPGAPSNILSLGGAPPTPHLLNAPLLAQQQQQQLLQQLQHSQQQLLLQQLPQSQQQQQQRVQFIAQDTAVAPPTGSAGVGQADRTALMQCAGPQPSVQAESHEQLYMLSPSHHQALVPGPGVIGGAAPAPGFLGTFATSQRQQ
jgi:hypothetical protein